MLSGGSACTPRKANHITGLNALSHLDQVFVLVTVQRFKTIPVLDGDTISVTIMRPRKGHHAIKGAKILSFGLVLRSDPP